MALLTILAGIFFLVVVGLAAFSAVRAAIAMFRALGAVAESSGRALDEVLAGVDAAGRHAERLPEGVERLSADAERLAASRAQLAFVLGHLADVRRAVTGVRAAVLGK